MRYVFLLLISLITLFSSVSFAQDTTTFTQSLDISRVYWNQINNIVMRFCNNWLEADKLTANLSLFLEPDQEKKVCIVFFNKSNVQATIQSDVFSAQLSKGWNYLCSNKDTLIGDVLVSDFSQLSEDIVLAPQEQVVKYFTVKANEFASWEYLWCLAYNLNVKEKLSVWSPFDMVVRKAANITINVDGSVKNNWFDLSSFWKIDLLIIICFLLVLFGLFRVFFVIKNKKSKKKPVSKTNKKQVRTSKVHHKKK